MAVQRQIVGWQSWAETQVTDLEIEQLGKGPRILFVHGSVSSGAATWKAQYSLADRWTLLILNRRGFGKSASADGEDFEVDALDIADALGEGAHLVAHSYGGVGALLAAATRPRAVHSLTLVEPMAYYVALDQEHVRQSVEQVGAYFARTDAAPRDFLGGFFQLMGVQANLPDPLPRGLETATRLLMRCRYPWTAKIPLDDLGDVGFRTLVVSGGHSSVFETICDVLATRLGADRQVIRGAGHSVPRTGAPFNERLESFLWRGRA
jgi:pimeloyl-ACP methyl ester carboxylesterase